MIKAVEQEGSIPGLEFRAPLATNGGYYHNLIGTKANNRASISYVTGAHNMKVGYQGGFNNPGQEQYTLANVFLYRMNGGVVNRLSQNSVFPGTQKFVRNLI